MYFLQTLFISAVFLSIVGVKAVERSELFPFGDEVGDSTVPPNDDSFANVSLSLIPEFLFFNGSYRNLFVNNNGGVSFLNGIWKIHIEQDLDV